MTHSLQERVTQWSRDASSTVTWDRLFELLLYYDQRRYREYLPTWGGSPLGFVERLRDWINCVDSDDDQKTLFELAGRMVFVGRDEMTSLYRSALRGPIVRWLIDLLGLNLADERFSCDVSSALAETWFCSVTDSCDIAAFVHANSLSGASCRPTWDVMARFASPGLILDYMHRKGLRRLVLLEDFVGSGSQMKKPAEYAAKNVPPSVPVLLIPLICCPSGVRMGERLSRENSNLRFEPLVIADEGALIASPSDPYDAELFARVRELAIQIHEKVVGHAGWRRSEKPYGPLGYGDTGAIIVTYSNCPDNTLPMVHHSSSSWQPLFPRISRE
jgi:hypothetical protein